MSTKQFKKQLTKQKHVGLPTYVMLSVVPFTLFTKTTFV